MEELFVLDAKTYLQGEWTKALNLKLETQIPHPMPIADKTSLNLNQDHSNSLDHRLSHSDKDNQRPLVNSIWDLECLVTDKFL
mmetsp:Transcript_18846/g.21644  ORF Transcript_18846/g.21644 Transcript_18846/m.21644 type:complete len:83 (+) Transcript_18846:21-269(+)